MVAWLILYSVILLLQVETVGQRATGGWGIWGGWSSCSVTCGYGVTKRNRQWVYQDGEVANYTFTAILECYINKTCPIHGKWSMWTGWSLCPVMCGGAEQKRSRICNAPKPSYGGKNCNGTARETAICNNRTCPDLPFNFDVSTCNSSNSSIFICESQKHCVPMKDRCDYVLDCHDGTDEKDCIISMGIGMNSSIQKSKYMTVIFTLVMIWDKMISRL